MVIRTCFSEWERFYFSVSRGIITPGSTHSNEFDADIDVGTIEKVKFLWNNNVVNPTLPKVGAAKITVQKGEDKTEYVSLRLVPKDVCRDLHLSWKLTPESQLRFSRCSQHSLWQAQMIPPCLP